MQHGQLTDADVARTLWKALVIHDGETGEIYLMGDDYKRVPLPHFSTDIEDSHKVVAHMQQQGWTLSLKQDIEHGESSYWAAFLKNDDRTYIFVRASTLPMALCLAALSAYGGMNIKRD